MATRKKSKKVKKSAQKKPSRRKRSESGNSTTAEALVSWSTVFVEDSPHEAPQQAPPQPPAPRPQKAPVASPRAPLPAGPRVQPRAQPSPPAAQPAPQHAPHSAPHPGQHPVPYSLTHHAPAVPAPEAGAEHGRILKHAPPSAGEVMKAEPTPAPKRRPRAKPAPSPRLPLPENLTQAQIYEVLAALLVPYARRMESEMHPKLGFCLKARSARTGREAHFGGVQALPDGVAFHLFPLYSHPELLEGVSPDLFNRMRSKTHFHFEELNAGLLDELMQLTREGFERFLADGMA